MSKKQLPGESFNITSEEEAVKLLQQALGKQFDNTNIELSFKNWPALHLEYEGEKFKGTITPDIAKSIVELQEALNRVYMLAVHNTTNLQGLEQDKKQELALVATVKDGCSLINLDLGDFAKTLVKETIGKNEW